MVQRRRVQTYGAEDEPYTQPRIHAVVFDPGAGFASTASARRHRDASYNAGTGELKELNVNWKQELDKLGPIYNLYAPETAEARAERLGDGGADVVPETPKKRGFWERLRG